MRSTPGPSNGNCINPFAALHRQVVPANGRQRNHEPAAWIVEQTASILTFPISSYRQSPCGSRQDRTSRRSGCDFTNRNTATGLLAGPSHISAVCGAPRQHAGIRIAETTLSHSRRWPSKLALRPSWCPSPRCSFWSQHFDIWIRISPLLGLNVLMLQCCLTTTRVPTGTRS